MLQNIRDNSTGIVAKIIVGLIALTFVVTGVQFVSFGGSEPEVAVVNDEPITEVDFRRELDTQRRQLLTLVQDPALIDENILRSQVLDSLIQQTAVLTEAQRRGLTFGDAQIDALLTSAPEFQENGQFSPALFDQFVARQGFGRVGFREALQEQLVVNQWTSGLADSAFATPSQVELALKLEGQKRSVALQAFTSSEQSLIATPSNSDLETLYQADTARWMRPQTVTVDYVLLDRDRGLDLDAVDEAEVRDAYERYVTSLSASQENRASHILLMGDDSLAQAEAALARINAGETFEAVAAEVSQDPLSAQQGGDLGFADPSTYVPEFAQALEALSVGEMSGPVETPFGHHIIKLTESRAQTPDSYDVRANELRRQLAEQQAGIRYDADAEELANIAFSGDLEEAAEVLGLDIQTSQPFTQEAGSGVAENLGIRVAAFGDEVQAGENSTLLEVEAGVIVLRLNSSEPERQLALDEVRDELVAAWEAQQRAQQAQQAAQSALADLSAVEAQLVTRSESSIPAEVVQAIFAMAPGQQQAISASNGDAYAVELREVVPGGLEDTVGMSAFLTSQARQQAGRALGEWAQSNAQVER